MDDPNRDSAGAAPHAQVLEQQKLLKNRARATAAAAAALNPLAKEKAFLDLGKLPGILAAVEKKIGPEQAALTGVDETLKWVSTWLGTAREELRRKLGSELKQACEEAGLPMRVIGREEPIEVRIAPFSVIIDRDKGLAELRFARRSIATCRADASDIVAAHCKALKALAGSFNPERFFERCHSAWRAARAADGRPERVELLDFLPFLALEMQAGKFQVDPVRSNYKDYSRAQFAFDVWRLKQAGKLTHGGVRVNFGVATGTSTAQKKRVIYFEDDQGNGEYKLTIYFTKQQEARTP